MMYHLFEGELKGISTLNAIALAFFSIGSFIASADIAIFISGTFASGPLNQTGGILFHQATIWIGILAALFYLFGVWCVLSRKNMIDQIKRETRSNPNALPSSFSSPVR